MSYRSADATIKGYYYQFNKTIESILDSDNENSIFQIEGVEDIDIQALTGTNYVQCKYYSASTLSASAIRDATILMLNDYVTKYPATSLSYTLFGYFKNEVGTRTVSYTLNELKDILTYTEKKITRRHHIDNAIPDSILSSFASKFSVVVGKEFEVHRTEIITKLKSTFSCSDYEAENVYYNNAVRIIFDKAILRKDIERAISQKEFLSAINTSKVLFFEWFRKYKDEQKYLKMLKAYLAQLNIFSPTKDKLLIIGKHFGFGDSSMPISVLLETLADKYFPIGTGYRAKPLTVAVDLPELELLRVKEHLTAADVKYNDGNEMISFSVDWFCEEPLINKSGGGKITKASFRIRLISYQTLLKHASTFTKRFSVLHVSEETFSIPADICNQVCEVRYVDKAHQLLEILKSTKT